MDLAEVEELFWRGLSLPPAARPSWLSTISDDKVRHTVASMLEDDEQAHELTSRIASAFQKSDPALAPGTSVGPWQIDSVLGSGAHGVVYLAHRSDGQFELKVAIKLIAGSVPSAAVQLRHETRVLASLVHPGIARLLDAGETADGIPYLVMEYIEGQPLIQACNERGLSLRERIRVVRDVALAVDFAHQHLVVHSDLKPANILLRSDGRPVLLDFGVSKLIGAETSDGKASNWLTPAYASPEQIAGDPVSTLSDVFSLGVVLCELLTGHSPYRVARPAGTRFRRLRDITREHLPADLAHVVERACSFSPTARHPSARSLADELSRWMGHYPVHSAPRSPGYVIRKFLRRRPVESLAFAAAVAVVAALGIGLERQRHLAQRHAHDAEVVSAFLMDLFRQADPGTGNRLMTGEDLVAVGEQHLDALGGLDPRMEAQLSGALGEVARRLGRPQQASALLERAVAASAAIGLPAERHATLLLELASTLDHRARYSQAAQRYAEALATIDGEAHPEQHAEAAARLGLMQSRQRDFSTAERTLIDAREWASAHLGPTHPLVSQTTLYLAEMYVLSDRRALAAGLSDAPVARLRRAFRPQDPRLLEVLVIQANVLRELSRTTEAEALLTEVLAHRRAMLAEDSWLVASVHNALGHVYYDRGLSVSAFEQFALALSAARGTLAPRDPALATHLNNLAELYEERGEAGKGVPLMREALGIVESNPFGNELQVVRYRQNLGRLLLLAEALDEAGVYLHLPIPTRDDPRFRLQEARQRLHLAEWNRRRGNLAYADSLLDGLYRDPDALGGAGSHRFAFALRVRAAMAESRGRVVEARTLLGDAVRLASAAKGEDYVGTGMAWLELAELEWQHGTAADAKRASARADEILSNQLLPGAPALARLAAVRDRSRSH